MRVPDRPKFGMSGIGDCLVVERAASSRGWSVKPKIVCFERKQKSAQESSNFKILSVRKRLKASVSLTWPYLSLSLKIHALQYFSSCSFSYKWLRRKKSTTFHIGCKCQNKSSKNKNQNGKLNLRVKSFSLFASDLPHSLWWNKRNTVQECPSTMD